MHSPARRAAKALAGLVVAAGLALAAAPPGRSASTGEGATVKQILSEKLPNVPGKTLTVVEVDYRPGGFSAPHRHPAPGFVFAYVLSPSIRSQAGVAPPPPTPPPVLSSRMPPPAASPPRARASPSASTAPARAGPSRPTPTTSS